MALPSGVSQAVWGSSVRGLAPTVIRQIRGNIPGAIFPHSSAGLCTTTVIHLAFGAHKDPAVSVPANALVKIVAEMSAQQGLLERVKKVWPQVLSRQNGGSIWQKVRGPLSMAAAYVRYLGWRFPAADRWVDHEGNHWQIDGESSIPDLKLLADRLGKPWLV